MDARQQADDWRGRAAPAAVGRLAPTKIRMAAALMVPAFLTVILSAHVGLSDAYLSSRIFEPPLLLPILNVVFLGLSALAVCVLASKSYFRSGRASLVLLGAGALALGLVGVSAGWFIGLPEGVNKAVTIFNCGALLAGLLHFSSAIVDVGEFAPQADPARRRFNLAIGYGGAMLALGLIIAATVLEKTPLFFVQQLGPTMARQLVLGAAIMLLLVSGLYQFSIYYKSGTGFFFWYALGLVTIAVGLLGISLGRTIGGIIGWTGRIAQYTGGIYLLAAVIDTLRERSPEDVLSEVFKRPGELYTSLFANSLDGMVIAAHEGPVLSANPAASAMLGFDAAQFRQVALMDLFDAALPEYRDFVGDLTRKGRARAEVVLAGRDGVRFPAAAAVAVFKDSTGRWLEILTFKDISDRRQAEQALADANERTRTILESITDGFLALDRQWRFTYINATGAAMVGMTRDEMIGQNVWELFPHATSRKFFGEYHRAVAHDTPVHFEEFYPEPMNKWVECHGYPSPDGLTVFYRDITERKRAEKALQEREARLKASLAEKEVLLKEIHHRVKNNLQVISSLVALQMEGLEDAAARPIFQDVAHRVRSMAMVHEKLYQSADLALVDFADYAQSLLTYLCRAHADKASSIHLDLDLEPVSLPVHTAVPFGLILNELFGNALKHAFGDRTGGRICVSLQEHANGQLRLSVQDDGKGLPPDLDWQQSASLGLRLVKMLCRQIHAAIEVASDEGAQFTLIFERHLE